MYGMVLTQKNTSQNSIGIYSNDSQEIKKEELAPSEKYENIKLDAFMLKSGNSEFSNDFINESRLPRELEVNSKKFDYDGEEDLLTVDYDYSTNKFVSFLDITIDGKLKTTERVDNIYSQKFSQVELSSSKILVNIKGVQNWVDFDTDIYDFDEINNLIKKTKDIKTPSGTEISRITADIDFKISIDVDVTSTGVWVWKKNYQHFKSLTFENIKFSNIKYWFHSPIKTKLKQEDSSDFRSGLFSQERILSLDKIILFNEDIEDIKNNLDSNEYMANEGFNSLLKTDGKRIQIVNGEQIHSEIPVYMISNREIDLDKQIISFDVKRTGIQESDNFITTTNAKHVDLRYEVIPKLKNTKRVDDALPLEDESSTPQVTDMNNKGNRKLNLILLWIAIPTVISLGIVFTIVFIKRKKGKNFN